MERNVGSAKEQAEAAAGEPVAVVPRMDSNQSLAPYFIDYVIALLNLSLMYLAGTGRNLHNHRSGPPQLAEAAIKTSSTDSIQPTKIVV